MSATVEAGTAIRPFHVEFAGEAIDDLRTAHRRDPLADQGARRRPLAGRPARDGAGRWRTTG